MDEKSLFKIAKKVIPLSRLRKEAPHIKSKSKDPFIEYLFKNKRDRLEYWIQYYSLLKKHSVFFLCSKKRLIFEKLKKRYKIPIDENNDVIYDVKNYKDVDGKQMISLNVHSEKRELRNIEDAETLQPINIKFRKPFNITFIYHVDSSILECRTKNINKIYFLQNFICNIFDMDEKELNLIKLSKEDIKNEIKSDTRAKIVILKDIDIAGAQQITIIGENVDETLNYFKNKGIDLESVAKEATFKKISAKNIPITLHENGKISFKRKVGDIYSLLKPVLVKKCQELLKGM